MQHPPRSVPIKIKDAYRAELDRLTSEGIIAPVHEHTDWINSELLVKKLDGSIRLCLDLKDLNKCLKRNKYYEMNDA